MSKHKKLKPGGLILITDAYYVFSERIKPRFSDDCVGLVTNNDISLVISTVNKSKFIISDSCIGWFFVPNIAYYNALTLEEYDMSKELKLCSCGEPMYSYAKEYELCRADNEFFDEQQPIPNDASHTSKIQ